MPGLVDEFVFGMSYEELDRILKKIENNSNFDDEDPQKVQRVLKILKAAEKRKTRSVKITDL